MESSQLHKAQVSILRTIRRAELSRYSHLMRPTGMDSDSFKFHLRKLIKNGFITKTCEGDYQLTPSGKEFANNLDRVNRTVQKQPKLSAIIVASRIDHSGAKQYLFQKRLRHPYWDYWGFISGPVRWGVTPEEAAAHELLKQTGITASFEVRCFYRKQDFVVPDETLLEDKQFIVVEATDLKGELTNTWDGGHNAWLTPEQFQSLDKQFADTLKTLEMLQAGETYRLVAAAYTHDQY